MKKLSDGINTSVHVSYSRFILLYMYLKRGTTDSALTSLPYYRRSNIFEILMLLLRRSCSIFLFWGRRLPIVKTFSMFAGEKLDLLGEITHFIRENSDSDTADADLIECTESAFTGNVQTIHA